MNAVEIERAISDLAERPFDPEEFPFLLLQALGNPETTIKRLRKGGTNKSDLGGVLQTNNIHIVVSAIGEVAQGLAALKGSPATVKAKAKFILATDGNWVEAEDLASGNFIACEYSAFADEFLFFLPLAGITTIKPIGDSDFDVKATFKLNKLYIELLKDNPDWGEAARRHDMNHFMARLIFCFFAERTDIFPGIGLFTETVGMMSAKDSSNTHEVIGELFRSMNIKREDRASEEIPKWADEPFPGKPFPYVNGELFSGSVDAPKFSKIARSYLIHIGGLDWTKINPDIFGSMIQAVAEDDERDTLGMHYTNVPNILKVLNPLFLDDLRTRLSQAEDNSRILLNLRRRMSRIRVFDPACGSGNFLVIAYKEMRAIEAEINKRRGEVDRRTEIPLTNFRGIELRDFPAEVARLALIIAEFQCDVLYRGQKEALRDFLPLDSENWITCGNALRLDWLSICPPSGTGVKHHAEDLFQTPLDQAQIDFENEGGETYICGNPQFKGARKQTKAQKEDMLFVFGGGNEYKDCDYVTAWYLKAADFTRRCDAVFAFVSTSSISEGEQVAHLWSRLYRDGCHIIFAHRGFKWRNNAANNAAVQCVIIGVGRAKSSRCLLYDGETVREVDSISPYLIAGPEQYVGAVDLPLCRELSPMAMGSMARDDGNLILTLDEAAKLVKAHPEAQQVLRAMIGTQELIYVRNRKCIWIEDEDLGLAEAIPAIKERIEKVKIFRKSSTAKTTRGYAAIPHKFAQRAHKNTRAMIVSATSSEDREYIPVDIIDERNIITNAAYAVYAPAVWELAVVASSLHMAWIATVCGKLETRLRYSSTLGWNTFPIPTLTEKNKADLTRCAEDILIAREAHFPATIAELYEVINGESKMPADLREAHERNDDVLERIYIGRRFRNDTERLEKLFEMYTKMIAGAEPSKKRKGVA